MSESHQVGRYIVSDAKICHGQPTFRGTRILVADVLDQVAEGLSWETIVEEWHGSITAEAITEAVSLAGKAFLDHGCSLPSTPRPHFAP
jgi:uncharacterized protein (DUF433 family)